MKSNLIKMISNTHQEVQEYRDLEEFFIVVDDIDIDKTENRNLLRSQSEKQLKPRKLDVSSKQTANYVST